jgi:hypothetical protein
VYSSETAAASVSMRFGKTFAAGWYNLSMWKPLFAGAMHIAIAVAIIAPTFYAVDPWLNVWMSLCGRSGWSDFKPCLARYGVQVDDLGFWVHTATASQKQNDVQPKIRDGKNGVLGKKQ